MPKNSEISHEVRTAALQAIQWLKRQPNLENCGTANARGECQAGGAAVEHNGHTVLDLIDVALDEEISDVRRSLAEVERELMAHVPRPTTDASSPEGPVSTFRHVATTSCGARYSTAHLQQWLRRTQASYARP